MADKKKKPLVTARDLSLIRWVGAAAVVLLFAYFGIGPAIAQHQTLEDENANAQAEVAKCSSEAPTLALQTQAETNYALVKQTLSGYPTTLDSSQIDQLVTQMAESHGLTVYSLSLNNKKSNSKSTSGYATAPTYTPTDVNSTSSSSSSSSTNGTELTGIHSNSVTVIFCGDEENLQNVIDSIGGKKMYPNVNLTAFSWGQNIGTTSASAATSFLTVEMTVYSYEDKTGTVSTTTTK